MMRMVFLIVLANLGIFTSFDIAQASSSSRCMEAAEKLRQSEIGVTIETYFPEPTINRNPAIEELQGGGGEMAPGFTRLAFVLKRGFYKMDLKNATIALPEGGYCGWVSGVSVLMGYMIPRIVINKASIVGSCRDSIIVWHEKEHVRNTRDSMKAHIPILSSRLRALVNLPPAAFPTLEAVKASLETQTKAILDDDFKQVSSIATRGDAALDTPENYTHQFDECR